MLADELQAWHTQHLAAYVADRVATGEPEETARRQVEQQHAGYFPGGRPADGHEVLVAESDGTRVGIAWWGPHPRRSDEPGLAFLYDIEVDEAQRGSGHGRGILAALEQRLLEAGVAELVLNVFGDNAVARRLYASAGFREVAITMAKQLGRDGRDG